MKFIFILGGTVGFATAAGTDWWGGRSPDRILVDGMVGCIAGAVLFRWFWTKLQSGVQETYIARTRAALAAQPTPAAPGKSKS